MKILMIDNDVFVQKNGELCIYKNTGEFALELKKLGHEVELFQTKHVVKSDFHDFNVLDKGLKITALKRNKIKLLTYINAYLVGAFRIISNDFVYIYYPTNYEYLAFWTKLIGKSYGLNVRGERGTKSKKSLLLFKFSKVVFTVSPYFTSLAASVGAKAFTQKPAISFNEKDIVRDRVFKSKSSYEVLFLARLDKDKGIFELIHSISILSKLNYNITLRIVGDGLEEARLKELVSLLNINRNVVFEGAVTDTKMISKFYVESDIFILPSHHEGFPRTLYEAMIFGTPILTTFVGGIPHLMKDGFNCFEIAPQSIDSITEKLKYVLNNYDSVKSIVENAFNTVEDIVHSHKPTHAMVLNDVLKNL